MDYAHSPESFYAPDIVKPGCAASPNSQYLFDQERSDIQSTLNNGILGHACTASDFLSLSSEPEFDLNPQYENSNSLEGYFGGGMVKDSLLSTSTGESLSMQFSFLLDNVGSCGLMGMDPMEGMQLEMEQDGPTLAQLNMVNVDPHLMEDIYSIIGENRTSLAPSPSPASQQPTDALSRASSSTSTITTPTPVKMEPSPLSPFQPPSQTQSQPSSSATSSMCGGKSNVAVVHPINGTPIKTEPMDTNSADVSKSCLHKMLSSPPLKPVVASSVRSPLSATSSLSSSSSAHPAATVVGESRPPSLMQLPVKTESVEEKWKEIEKFIHDPEQPEGRKRKRYASESSAIMSDDEDCHPQHYADSEDEDSDSDVDSDLSDSPLEESLTDLAKKSKQYFWQYNVQAKGPKGTRLKLRITNDDPHHPSSFEDPVFDATSTSLVGIRHGGKARKGDGNEVSPNPRKLCQIGQQLYRLSRKINSCQVSNDLPAHVRNKSRKEKNKLASRACRLKKKAQHEANKIKLTGLDTEQNELLEVLHVIWPLLKERAQHHLKGTSSLENTDPLTDQLEQVIKTRRKTLVASKTTDFVNEVIKKVEEGDPRGGLPIRTKIRK